MDADGIDTGDYAEYMTVPAGDLQPGVYLIGTDADQEIADEEDLGDDLDNEDDIEVAHISDGAPRLVYSVQSDDFWTRVELADLRAAQIYEEANARNPAVNAAPKRFTTVEAFGSNELVYILRIRRGGWDIA
ncbi:hypothetical protein O1W68_16115 [Rhodococcus sp. H36-A4]|uniref:hypothetical protein n=1 Tax=unclassified Rhodococcus (in: high G+C Gram-positive bacteria) TaxID=192944 RepID=UPI0022AEBB75|nr:MULTISPECIES: hypothetical protein [unclassified Rhodococcus (in: high G+C Gram-positive bacteria)]MCZ4079473.1 hypothetical protein [Rhodococcus sp. H36-A4]MDJ0358733.1 hypothetical protein [Rhodococcus sp. H29-C3]